MYKSLRDPTPRPTHPGAVLREDVLPEPGMTQAEFARRLGASRLTVNELLNESVPSVPGWRRVWVSR
jgi:antitoxin HigA-1